MLLSALLGLAVLVLISSDSIAQESKLHSNLIFGDWSLICPDKGEDKSACFISQSVATDPKGQKVLLGISVSFVGTPNVPRIDFRLTPTAVAEAGIGLKIDNGDEFRLPISECDKRICVASGLLDKNMLARLKNGTFCQLAYILPGGKQMTLPVSLKGFSKAYSNLTHMVKVNKKTKLTQ